MQTTKFEGCKYDFDTNEFEWKDEDCFMHMRDKMNKQGEEILNRKFSNGKIIYCYEDGSVSSEKGMIFGLTKTFRAILWNLEKGQCGKEKMKESVYTADELMRMKNPDSAMRKNVSQLNKILVGHDLIVFSDGKSYFIENFSKKFYQR